MRIRTMRVNHLKTPLGFECSYPVFSWIVEGCRGKRQTQARMKIALDQKMKKIIYDSEWQEEIKSTAFCPNVQLSPRTRYYWQIRIRTEKGEQGCSPVTWFETGKMEELWQGRWIEADFSKEDPKCHPLFQKTFQVPEDLAAARVYLAGFGMFEVVVNGQKVSEEYLTPYDTDVRHWIQYVTYDITEMLKKGKENVLGVSMGNGWDKSCLGSEAGLTELQGHAFKLLAEIRMETCLGKEIVVSTDDSWECAPSPVLKSRIYEGEVYDARLYREDFTLPGSVLPNRAVYAEKPDITVKDRLSPPVVCAGRVRPVRRSVMPSGEIILDFGQILAGWVEFECREPKGKEVCLQYGESMENGSVYQGNLCGEKAEMRYISDGRPKHVRPHFTCFRFRCVKITGLEEVKPGDFTGVVVHSKIRRTGEIRTSDPKINRLFQDSLWIQRVSWNPEVFGAASCFHMYIPGVYRKYLWQRKLENTSGDGSIVHKMPNVVIPWMLYQFYGDEVLLAEQYPIMQTWTDLDGMDDKNRFDNTEQGFIAAALSYDCAVLTAKAARGLGLVQDVEFYRTLAREIRHTLQKIYFTKEGTLKIETQITMVLALYLRLIPKKFREQYEDRLNKNIQQWEIQGEAGMMAAAGWMYRCLCGLNPTSLGSGLKRVVIAPKPDREMEYAECTYDSASGIYASGWEWTEQGICFRVTIPFDARARFELPFVGKQVSVNRKPCKILEKTGKLVLDAGTYEITVRL